MQSPLLPAVFRIKLPQTGICPRHKGRLNGLSKILRKDRCRAKEPCRGSLKDRCRKPRKGPPKMLCKDQPGKAITGLFRGHRKSRYKSLLKGPHKSLHKSLLRILSGRMCRKRLKSRLSNLLRRRKRPMQSRLTSCRFLLSACRHFWYS